MQPIAFCSRCRGMRVGWNTRYVIHCLRCRHWIYKSAKASALTLAVALVIVAFPVPTGIGFASLQPVEASNSNVQQPTVMQASLVPVIPIPTASGVSPVAVAAIDSMLAKYDAQKQHRDRVARAIVVSSRKYNLDSRLVAAVLIVESRADPHAISEAHSVGLMQIHLPTWGPLADKQGIDLFKIEDNVDLGSRILKGYISQYGVWEGVAHYTGRTDSPESQQVSDDYVRKVQKVFGFTPPVEN
jgi:soluble lytic murein transglycosylase-like protein